MRSFSTVLIGFGLLAIAVGCRHHAASDSDCNCTNGAPVVAGPMKTMVAPPSMTPSPVSAPGGKSPTMP